jgi:serine/threonine protein kinase/Flp pilus assembly protein TadD
MSASPAQAASASCRAAHTVDSLSADLLDGLADEMARRWRLGERPLAEEFFAAYPWLWEQPKAALELIAEEISLRQESGLGVDPEDLQRRFPQWRDQVRTLLTCHELLADRWVAARPPVVGDTVGDFRLVAELGRGSRGHVFLATQPSLAGRPVVLKLSPDVGQEHLSLGKLQHTHIVPLFSLHEFPAQGLFGLCLPYLGGCTLAQVLETLRHRPPGQRRGRDIVEALRQAQAAAPVHLAVTGPACQFFEQASYVSAVCWLGMCLADALHYAHERGLVHLDLKPSNILLAADGQPMLLDFHLTHAPLGAGTAAPVAFGGTPAYMPPEQQRALAAVREGQTVPVDVDGRADIYALGRVLAEALLGALPASAEDLAGASCRHPHVTPGLADILARCLAAEPGRRYATAGALATDLRCHLADLPLRGVRNRSPGERWRKWRRRRPYALARLGLLAAVLAVGVALLGHCNRVVDRAQAALSRGQDHLRQSRYAEASAAFEQGAVLIEELPFEGRLLQELRSGAHLADRARAAEELHQSCERIRALYGVDLLPPEQAAEGEALCAQLWHNRQRILDRLDAQPTAELDQQVRADLTDVVVVWCDLHARQTPDAVQVHEEALQRIVEAQRVLGPSCVLDQERRAQLQALGRPEGERAEPRSAATAWEHYAVGRACLRAGRLRPALAELEQALAMQPQALWPNFYKGKCAYQLGQFDEAVAAFSVCVALMPRSAWCFYHRGLAYLELGRLERAQADFDQALRLEPSLSAAALSRGIVHYRSQSYPAALADLQRAHAGGIDHATLHYHLALIHVARADHTAAAASLRRTLALEPSHTQARKLLSQLEERP